MRGDSASHVVALYEVVTQGRELFRRYPVLILPFVIIGVFDLLLLLFLFLFPFQPVSLLLSPAIRALWGDEFFHYPLNLLLLPQLFAYTREIASLVVGMSLTAIAVAMIYQTRQGKSPEWRFGARRVGRKFGPAALVWAVSLGAILVTVKALNTLSLFFSGVPANLPAAFLVSVLAQMFFIYTIPSVIIENKKPGAAIRRSAAIVKRYPLETFAVVLLPNLLISPIAYAYTKLDVLIHRFAPEVVVYLLGSRVIVLVFVNFVIVGAATLLFLRHREQEKETAGVRKPVTPG